MKSPIKYPGGKSWLVPLFEDIFAQHRDKRLVEPFCGSCAIGLGLGVDIALMNDINPHLINMFNQIKNGLMICLSSSDNNEQIYYEKRQLFNDNIKENIIDTPEMAELFYYLNRTGFNGMCRFNKSGFYNIPFGRYNKINYATDFRMYGQLFENWEFTSGSFDQVALSDNDFLYIDPPYVDTFSHYASTDFLWENHEKLAKWIEQFNGPVVVSNSSTDKTISLYKSIGLEIDLVDVKRLIAANSNNRGKVKEILAYKNI